MIVNHTVHITHAGDGSGRLFVVKQPGSIRIVENDIWQIKNIRNTPYRISTFAEDEMGGLHLAVVEGGGIYKINETIPVNSLMSTRLVRNSTNDPAHAIRGS